MPFIAEQAIDDRTTGWRLEFSIDPRSGDTKLTVYDAARTRGVTFAFDVNTGEVHGPARVEPFGLPFPDEPELVD